MIASNQKELQKAKRRAAVYSMVPNLLWTALFLTPVVVYCYTLITPKVICLLLGSSLISIFFRNSFFDKIQLSRSAYWYRRMGIKYVNAFAQNGSLINSILKKKYPDFKMVSKTKASVRKQYYQTYFFERFHFSLFLFFMIVTIHAGAQKQWYWVVILIVSNLCYNVYPNLLQQYIRVKLKYAITDKTNVHVG